MHFGVFDGFRSKAGIIRFSDKHRESLGHWWSHHTSSLSHNPLSFRLKNLPFPSFSKRGKNPAEKIPPLKKENEGGFEFDLNGCHHLKFLSEFWRYHTSRHGLILPGTIRAHRLL